MAIVKKKIQFPKSTNDTLIQAITIDDLLTAVTSNCKEINKQTIKQTYIEMIKEITVNGYEELNDSIDFVIEQTKQ